MLWLDFSIDRDLDGDGFRPRADHLPTIFSLMPTIQGRPPTAPPRIVGTMLSANAETLVADAIDSVIDHVDMLLLVDTGIRDRTIDVASDHAREKLVVRKLRWPDDFGEARNAALNFSKQLDARWSMTIDTDERMEFEDLADAESLLARLECDPNVTTWMVRQRDGSYAKERFIKLPTDLTWRGRTHEALGGPSLATRQTLTGVRFWEEPKSDVQMRSKLQRDLHMLLEETAEHPDIARWWYYLWQTL